MTGGLRRVHLLVEGQTEEVVADSVIRPHLEGLGWITSLSLVKTKRPAAGPSHKGGVTGWGQVRRDIGLLLNDTSLDVLTTLFDYYAFPADCPGMGDRPSGEVTSTSGSSTSSAAWPSRWATGGSGRTSWSTSWRPGCSPPPMRWGSSSAQS